MTDANANEMHVTLLNVTDKSSSDKLEKVRARKNHHIVTLYYRDGCPPCDRMKPEWKKACEQFKKMYKCKSEDARERTVIASVDDKGIKHLNNVFHDIQGTPTLLYMSDNKVHTYNEDRTADNMLKWLESSLKTEIEPITGPGPSHVNGLKGGCWTTFSRKLKTKSRRRRRRSTRKMKMNIKNRKYKK